MKALYKIKLSFLVYMAFVNVIYSQSSNWTPLGPVGRPAGNDHATGTGRLHAIAFDPNFGTGSGKNGIMYVGSPYGGLWKSTDHGTNWSNNTVSTDQLPVCGVGDIVIDPTNGQTIYVATGEAHDFQSHPSVGIYKSTNGGSTWSLSGLSFNYQDNKHISRLLISPYNTNIIFAATSDGLYRSSNGGSSWSLVINDGKPCYDIQFVPGSTTLIASGFDVYRSTDAGLSWTKITTAANGLDIPTTFPGKSVVRIAIAPTSSGHIYATLIAATGTYVRTNRDDVMYFYYFNGTSWIQRNSYTPPMNITTITRATIALYPGSSNVVFVGQTTVKRTDDGGVTGWNDVTTYNNNAHADIHCIKFGPDNQTLYVATDGGLFKITSSTSSPVVTELHQGLNISTIVAMGGSATNASKVLTGHMDNGSMLHNASATTYVNGGDGAEQMIDYSDESNMYSTIADMTWISRSTDGGNNWGSINEPGTSTVNIPPMLQDPINPNFIWVGRQQLWKSSDKAGTSWTEASDFYNDFGINFYQWVTPVAIAPSNSQIIYCAVRAVGFSPTESYKARIFRSDIGGGKNPSDWTELVVPYPPSYTAEDASRVGVRGIAISHKNPYHVWVCFSDPLFNIKVKKSIDGGATWTDESSGLPNLPMHSIAYEKGSNDGIYVSTDVGVYYKNKTMFSWVPFKTNLPNVKVTELEINYAVNKIRAATYGRGLWESSLACPFDLTLNVPTVNANFYEAKATLTSNAVVPNVSNQSISFRAGSAIHLNAGFNATGSTVKEFFAYIHACDLPYNSMKTEKESAIQELEDRKETSTKLLVYPNPNNGLFTVKTGQEGIKTVQVFDVLGKTVAQVENTGEREIRVDISSSPKGLYLVKVTTAEGKTEVVKILNR